MMVAKVQQLNNDIQIEKELNHQLKQDLQDEKAVNNELNQNLKILSATKEAEKDQVNQQNEILQEEKASLLAENAQLQEQLSQVKQSVTLIQQNLQDEIKEYQENILRVQNDSSQVELIKSQKEELNSFKDQVSDLEGKLTILEESERNLKDQIAQHEDTILKQQEELYQLEEELRTLKEEWEEQQSIFEEKQFEISSQRSLSQARLDAYKYLQQVWSKFTFMNIATQQSHYQENEKVVREKLILLEDLQTLLVQLKVVSHENVISSSILKEAQINLKELHKLKSIYQYNCTQFKELISVLDLEDDEQSIQLHYLPIILNKVRQMKQSNVKYIASLDEDEKKIKDLYMKLAEMERNSPEGQIRFQNEELQKETSKLKQFQEYWLKLHNLEIQSLKQEIQVRDKKIKEINEEKQQMERDSHFQPAAKSLFSEIQGFQFEW